MKFASVALSALAVALAVPATAQDGAPQSAATAVTFPLTPQGAADWVAAVEKDLFDYSVEASRVNWVNANFVTHDTDILTAAINAVGTEKSVKYALDSRARGEATNMLKIDLVPFQLVAAASLALFAAVLLVQAWKALRR